MIEYLPSKGHHYGDPVNRNTAIKHLLKGTRVKVRNFDNYDVDYNVFAEVWPKTEHGEFVLVIKNREVYKIDVVYGENFSNMEAAMQKAEYLLSEGPYAY
jgi:hypothetical protein